MKKELKSGILSADKSADCRPTVGEVNVISVLPVKVILKNAQLKSANDSKFSAYS